MKFVELHRTGRGFLRFSLGIAASGGAAFILSGSALADTSPVTTAQNFVSRTTNTVVNKTTTTTIDQTNQANVTTTVGTNDKTGNPLSSQSANDRSPRPDDGLPSGPGDSSKLTNLSINNSATSTDQKTSSNNSQTAITQNDPTTKSPDSGVALAQQTNGGISDTARAAIMSALQASTSERPGSAALMQSAISSRDSSNGGGFVPATPSKPSAPKAPFKSSGMFSELSSILASTVVPNPYTGHGLTYQLMFITLASITLLLVCVRLMSLSYGEWLRRSGYTNAARSDLTSFITSFATPLLLGYNEAFRLRHNPIFVVVSDNKIPVTSSLTTL